MESPYTKKRDARFRGPITSDDYNQRIVENYQDLTVLYNRARLSEVELAELYRRLDKNMLSLARVVQSLESRVQALEEGANTFSFYGGHTQVVTADHLTPNPLDHPDWTISTVDHLTLDSNHGVLTLPQIDQASLSKMVFTNPDGEETVPPGMEVLVQGDVSTADHASAHIDSSKPEYALYSKPGLIWERNVVNDSPDFNAAELTMYVRVPTGMFSTNQSNALVIHPFPHFGVTIQEISYTLTPDPLLRDSDGYNAFNVNEYYSGEAEAAGWVVPGGWTDTQEGNDAAVNTGPRRYIFPPKPITALRIRLRQDEYIEEASKYIYTYGLSRLDVRYDSFSAEGRAFIQVDAPEGGTISSIDHVEPQIWNVSPANILDVFDYRVIWETAPGSEVYTTEPVPFSERAWIEVTLRNDENWSPALSGLVVSYS